MYDLNSVRRDSTFREVTDICGDDAIRMTGQRSRENMPVVRVGKIETFDQGRPRFIEHLPVWYGVAHSVSSYPKPVLQIWAPL
ncbi:hypothetical protein CR51_16365 [Caballeronia megalochromosomata]|nr:hypothetical protein CR51_16365 [Caballeronia megalochromosomata]